MNKIIFKERLIQIRKQKFSSQRAFADRYKEKFGCLRKPRTNEEDYDMFGTIQAWEQGKSIPSAEAICNICDLLDCDADYLLGRMDERNHDIKEIREYTGLSEEAINVLHQLLHSVPFKYESVQYTRILSSLFITESFRSFLEQLWDLDSCFKQREAVQNELVNDLGEELFNEAVNIYKGPSDYFQLDLPEEVYVAIGKLEDAIDKQRESGIDDEIKVARYELWKKFELLIDNIYSKN